MPGADEYEPVGGRAAVVRLLVTAVVLGAAFVVFAVADVVDVDDVRALVSPAGPAAPLAFVLLAGLLGAALVPGPPLAAASGVLFGAWTGTATTVGAALVSALVALYLGRRAGRAGARRLVGSARADAVESLLERHGVLTVVLQRLAPGVPDAPMSYVGGALGLRTTPMVLGTLVGTLPRAFGYTALGASLDEPTGPLGLAALAVLVVVSAVGALVGLRAWRARRPAGPVSPGGSG